MERCRKYDLIAKVMAGNPIKFSAIKAGISSGQLYAWINKYKQLGYYFQKCTE